MKSFVRKHKIVRDGYQRSESAAQLASQVRSSITGSAVTRSSGPSYLFVDRDRAPTEGRALLQRLEDDEKKSEKWMDKCILSAREKLDSQSLLPDWLAEQDTGISVPSCSDETVPVAWEETSSAFLLNETDSLSLFQLSSASKTSTGFFLSFRFFQE